MKNSEKISRFRIALIIFLIIGASNDLFSQNVETRKLGDFLILVETTKDGIKLTGKEGCAWKELSFSYKSHSNQAIDQYGMTSLKQDLDETSNDPSSFLFTINKTKDGLSFEGIVGTAWENLSFSCPKVGCRQYIDQNGMRVIKNE